MFTHVYNEVVDKNLQISLCGTIKNTKFTIYRKTVDNNK